MSPLVLFVISWRCCRAECNASRMTAQGCCVAVARVWRRRRKRSEKKMAWPKSAAIRSIESCQRHFWSARTIGATFPWLAVQAATARNVSWVTKSCTLRLCELNWR
ncbi:hypothetical protein IWX49DRAFT_585163 [Phyllosticta citricarpa]